MTYKEAIIQQVNSYAQDPLTRFIGYNTLYGSRMYGTLSEVNNNQCLEAPVAENLMMGLAIGMCLEGYKPVVCFERHDFILLALDAITNHMDKLPYLSGYQYKLPIIVRAIVGSKNPLDPGPQHNNDYTEALDKLVKYTPVWIMETGRDIELAWKSVNKTPSGAVILVEHRDLYDTEI